ncbi:MAG: 50S ribosomal protein L25/general stress protein Ctc [Holosporales bacterium]|jgi:large subunit ribosomal protein L25|nr:50S ribosomal protein L25/general stress protein Ctc [Holosporales bacterium]
MSSGLKISKRNCSGTKESKKLRYDCLVPGVIYGAKKEPILVSVGEKELKSECRSNAFFNRIIEVNIGSNVEKIIPKNVDFHPVSDNPIHIDFQRISKDSKIKLLIPIEFKNEDKAPGLKKGGIINVIVYKLECHCPFDSMPEKIILDLTDKEIGDSIILSEIKLPKGVTPANPERDSIIATIVGARSAKEEDKSDSEKTADSGA